MARKSAPRRGFELELRLLCYVDGAQPEAFLSAGGVPLDPAKLNGPANRTRAKMEVDKLLLEGSIKVMDDNRPVEPIGDYIPPQQLRTLATLMDEGKLSRTAVRMAVVNGKRILQIELEDRKGG